MIDSRVCVCCSLRCRSFGALFLAEGREILTEALRSSTLELVPHVWRLCLHQVLLYSALVLPPGLNHMTQKLDTLLHLLRVYTDFLPNVCTLIFIHFRLSFIDSFSMEMKFTAIQAFALHSNSCPLAATFGRGNQLWLSNRKRKLH